MGLQLRPCVKVQKQSRQLFRHNQRINHYLYLFLFKNTHFAPKNIFLKAPTCYTLLKDDTLAYIKNAVKKQIDSHQIHLKHQRFVNE
jgi:hypothetical protein